MYIQALQLAYLAHDGQLRKQSLVPYIVHPIRVASHFNDDEMRTIAVLHDVLEDTNITIEKLNNSGMFTNRVIITLDVLTKKEGEKYFDYIKRVSKNLDAREIKIMDLVDNLSDTITICKKEMVDRYNKALGILVEWN